LLRYLKSTWRWETFYDRSSFIEEADRHLENCTERYAFYASERMEKSVRFVSQLKEHIQYWIASTPAPNLGAFEIAGVIVS